MVFSVFLKQLLYCSRLRIPLSFATKRLNSTNRMWLDRPSPSEVGVRVMFPDEKNRSDHGKSWTLLITILFLSNAGDISLKDIFISALSAGAIYLTLNRSRFSVCWPFSKKFGKWRTSNYLTQRLTCFIFFTVQSRKAVLKWELSICYWSINVLSRYLTLK